MSARRPWRVPASLLSVALATATIVASASAQDAAPTQVAIAAVGDDGVAGLALLSASPSGGTAVQIIVASAPADTFAVIHAGDCDDIDPAPVALLGDVSSTSQVSIANPLASVADGGHVLALHAGLDLATAVGCGAIPRAVGAPADPSQQPTTQSGSFTGPVTGMTIEWPDGWQRYEVVEAADEDRIGLAKGATSVFLTVRREPGADPQACVRDAGQDLFDELDAGTLRDLEPLADADGTPISGAEPDRAWLAYRYAAILATGEADVADYLECRVAGDLRLFVLHRSTPESYAQDAVARDELLAGVVLPSRPVPAPTPSPATENADCDGYASWHEATVGRTDELLQLKSDVDQATNEAVTQFDLTPYKQVLKRAVRDLARMRLAQEGESAPPAAQETQRLAVAMYAAYENAAQILSDYYETSTDRATLERADHAQKAAGAAEDEFGDALVAVEAVCE